MSSKNLETKLVEAKGQLEKALREVAYLEKELTKPRMLITFYGP